MQTHRPTATIEPPSLGNTATEAFRIADVKLEARSFLDDLGKVFTEISASATVPEPLKATDLRIKTLEEAIQTATTAPSEDELISSDSGQAGPSNPAPVNGLPSAPQQRQQIVITVSPGKVQQGGGIPALPVAAPAPAVPASRIVQTLPSPAQFALPGEVSKEQRQQVVDAYNTAVAAAKQKYEQERTAATQHLHTLYSHPLESEKLMRRSFAKVKPPEPATIAVESAPGAATATTTAPAAAAAAAAPAADVTVPAGEVVVRVAIHLPQAPAYVSEEWLVLGSQSLTELRDALYCLTETNIKMVEREENVRRPATSPLSLSQPSSYFYIEGSFYMDTRSPSNTNNNSTTGDGNASTNLDISEGIRKYLKQLNVRAPPHPLPGPASRPLGPFTTDYSVASMQDRVFEDLWVRLGNGAAGLFCHQGGCEHLFVFLDVRSHDPTVDPPLVGQYPYKVADPGSALRRKRDCEACGLKLARKVTYDDRSAPHTPYFWCDDCYSAMHYDDEGAALYTDFRVFPYEADYNPIILHEKSAVGGAAAVLRRDPFKRTSVPMRG
jgi:hypothetical protein